MKNYKILFAFLLSLALFSCSTRPVKVVCVGDSITEGSGLEVESKTAYPVALGKLLGADYTVLNFGRSATTMNRNGDFPYWIAKEFSNVFAALPDIIVIKLGTNDTKPENWNANDFRNSFQAMIDTFNTIASKPKIFLCYPVPVYEIKWGINDSTVTAGVIPAIDKLAARNNLPVIDLYHGLQNQIVNFPDGIHPNEQGAANIAKLIAEELLK
jgi:acyl-CoA thioesterase-1